MTVDQHLSTQLTASPDEISTYQTAGSAMTSSSSRDASFYFGCAVVAIAIVGAAANALILYALVASKQHTKHVLIFNQNVLDFVSCLFLGITYTAKLCDVVVTGARGYWLCMTLLSDASSWSLLIVESIPWLSHQPRCHHRRTLPEGRARRLGQQTPARLDHLLGNCIRMDRRHCCRCGSHSQHYWRTE